jgi:hypothetical protein
MALRCCHLTNGSTRQHDVRAKGDEAGRDGRASLLQCAGSAPTDVEAAEAGTQILAGWLRLSRAS